MRVLPCQRHRALQAQLGLGVVLRPMSGARRIGAERVSETYVGGLSTGKTYSMTRLAFAKFRWVHIAMS